MKSLIFVDSYIFFSFFAIDNEKQKSYNDTGTTGKKDLDLVLKLIKDIEEKNNIICLSEVSILEIVCTLNRLNSAQKFQEF